MHQAHLLVITAKLIPANAVSRKPPCNKQLPVTVKKLSFFCLHIPEYSAKNYWRVEIAVWPHRVLKGRSKDGAMSLILSTAHC